MTFTGTEDYWEQRYASGGNSGTGSRGYLAQFKADVINSFVDKNKISTVIEFGCGDGHQLSLANYPKYIGLDVSQTIVSECTSRFATDSRKTFKLMRDYNGEMADLSLSLDVIFHLIEDETFESYMQTLFKAANRYVIVYASDLESDEANDGAHVRHRAFTKWISSNMPRWKLIEHIPNRYPYDRDRGTGSFAEFYIYGRA